MKKILVVNDGFPPTAWGGANTIALWHAKELRKRGYNVRVFTTTQDAFLKTGWGEYEGVSVCTFYTNYHPRWWAYLSLYNGGILKQFEQELRKFAPEVVHFHNIHHFFSYAAITIAKDSGAKVFLTAHDVMSFAYQKLRHFIDYGSKSAPTSFNYRVSWWTNLQNARKRFNPMRNFIIRRHLRAVHKIFAVSVALKQALAHNGIGGNVEVVRNGIDVDSFRQGLSAEGGREKLSLGGKKVILFLGRLTPDKGRDVLLKALALVCKEIESAHLLVVGFPKGQDEPALWNLVNKLHLNPHLTLLPPVESSKVSVYYGLADVVVVPSVVFDSFPTINLEAMAAGKPVISTCFGGSSEIVREGITGFILNPLDTELFAQKIITLLRNPERAEAMGRAGLEIVRRDFSLGKQIDSYLDYYKKSVVV